MLSATKKNKFQSRRQEAQLTPEGHTEQTGREEWRDLRLGVQMELDTASPPGAPALPCPALTIL